jgi:anti-sigma28 factor (negative regulator of flagellin synthesis)
MIHNIPENNFDKTRYVTGRGKVNNGKNVSSSDSDKKAELKEDTLMLSNEGRAAQQVARYTELARQMPDEDPQRIKRVAENIKNGTYFTPQAADAVAEKILDTLQEEG